MTESLPPQRQPQRHRSRLSATLRALLRTRVTAGLLIVLPIYITILLVRFVFTLMRDASLWVVEAYLRSQLGKPLLDQLRTAGAPRGAGQTALTVTEALAQLEQRLGRAATREEFFDILPRLVEWGIAVLSVLLTIAILYAVGMFAANIVGRRIIEWLEQLLDRVPLVKTIYRSTKQILATFAGEQSRQYRRVALIPFPDQTMRCVGFVTSTFTDSLTGQELASVFIPTTPNPTTGYLQILKRSDLVELDWSVEDAVRAVMSGGILLPEFVTMVQSKDRDGAATATQARNGPLPANPTP